MSETPNQAPAQAQAPAEGDEMLEPLIYAAVMHNGKPKTVAEFERAAANVADMLQRRAEVTHEKPVASIYISADGSREFDDWRVDLPPGNHQLFTAPRPDQPQPESLPHPGAPEAEEMIEKLLAECNRPSNMKNAARAGYMAAKRLLQHARQPLPATDDAEPNVQPKGTEALDALAELCDMAKGGWDLPPSAVERIGALARKASAALQAPAPAHEVPAGWRDAMQEALSVCDSVSMSRDRRVVREGCVLYLQTEEWCKWAEQEVAPKLRQALEAATVQAPAVGVSWTPTAENINALPQPVRDYIHALAANCDPAGTVADNTIKADLIRELQASNRRIRDELDTPGNRWPEARYAGYTGQPYDNEYTADQAAAFDEGRRARVGSQPPVQGSAS